MSRPHLLTAPCRFLHLSSDFFQNCTSLSNVGETLSSAGVVQPAWSYSRFNAVAYNVTGGLNLSLGSVHIPPLPMQAGGKQPRPHASSGFSAPAVLRLVNSSTESTGDPNILIFSNDDDVSGWNTVPPQHLTKTPFICIVLTCSPGTRSFYQQRCGQSGCRVETVQLGARRCSVEELSALSRAYWM